MRRLKPMPRRLYFFPALVPLVELVPWLLTLLGAVAGAAGFTSFVQKHRRIIWALAFGFMVAAGLLYVKDRGGFEIMLRGTRAIPASAFTVPLQNNMAPIVQLAPPTAFAPIWTKRMDKQILSTPVIAGGKLIYGLFKGDIGALDTNTGAPLWRLTTPNPVFALTLGPKGRLYACEGLHTTRFASLYAITPESGVIQWQRSFSGHLEETISFSADDKSLYLGTGPNGLWRVGTNDGAVIWHADIGHIDAAPLVDGDKIYVPAQDERAQKTYFYALNAADGTVAWRMKLPGQPWGSPVMNEARDRILTTTGNGQIGITRETDAGWAQGISLDGQLLWQLPLPGMPLQPSLYIPREDIIIHSIKSGDIVALHASDGGKAWTAEAEGDLHAPATLARNDELLVAVTYDGNLTIHDAATGKRIALWAVGKHATASPVADGDQLYVTTGWDIHAFNGLRFLK